jgi:hypothetical protein
MITEFERFSLDIPAALAIAIARLDLAHYPAVVDRVLRDYPELRQAVFAINAADLITTLNGAHVGDFGNDIDMRRRLVYLAAGRIANNLRHVGDSPVMSQCKYDALRAAYRELHDHHLRQICA